VLPGGYQLQIDLGKNEWQQITGENVRASKRGAGLSSRRGKRMLAAGADLTKLVLLDA
jgi:hypothetical protein